MRVVRQLADAVDDGERGLELRLRQFHVAHELMQMGDQRRHDLAQARIRRALHGRQGDFGEMFVIVDDHGGLPRKM